MSIMNILGKDRKDEPREGIPSPAESGKGPGQNDPSREQLCRSIAERIYNLDSRVYTHIGSSLGRTLISPRKKSIDLLTAEISAQPDSGFVYRNLALIANMARTIPDRQTRSRAMKEYNAILTALKDPRLSTKDADIGDLGRISLNPLASLGRNHFTTTKSRKFTGEDHLLICIGRSYGSGGTDIGFQLADQLHISYYDATVFQDVLDRLQAEKESKAEDKTLEETLRRDQSMKGLTRLLRNFNRFHGLPPEDALYFNQSEYIETMARKQDFVVMGRSADVVLRNARIPHISIFITAPFEMRVRRISELRHISLKEAARDVKRQDKAHERFYHRYTGLSWGNAVHYDLCINSASYGIQESVELILRVIRARVQGDLRET